MYGMLCISVAPDPVLNIVAKFSPNTTTRGIYNIIWTPPVPTNGSFYQILEYFYSSAYNIGPTYSSFFRTTELDQSQNQFIFDAFYYTNYNFAIKTINIKYNITNGLTRSSDQSSPAGIYTYNMLISIAMQVLLYYYSAYSCSSY